MRLEDFEMEHGIRRRMTRSKLANCWINFWRRVWRWACEK
jgi:hypothetical protein